VLQADGRLDSLDLADEGLLIAIANTGHGEPDELADRNAVAAWWAQLTGGDEFGGDPQRPNAKDVERLRVLRAVIRRLTWANNGWHLEPEPAEEAVLAGLALRLDLTSASISLRVARASGLSDAISAAAIGALIRASARPNWPRLKACHALDCGWVFLDASRNASRRWCDMGDCGNRAKGAAFRERERQGKG
jgi:predicted RNA-binding Zn ribbon-like protein